MTRIHLSSDGMGRSFGLFRAVRFAVVSVTGRFGRPGQVRDEQVERIPRTGPRRREGWKGIREIFTVCAVHHCRQYGAPTPLTPAPLAASNRAPGLPAAAYRLAPPPSAIDNSYHPSWTVDVW